MSHVTLLGPQRLRPTLSAALDSLEARGRIATVTAGWQEREADDRELHEHLGERSVNLRLYQRTEELFRRDPELAAAHRRRQERLREMQDLYAQRLDFAMDAAYAFLRRRDSSELMEEERAASIEAVRALDARHLERVQAVHAEFEERWHPLQRDSVQDERRELQEILGDAAALAVAGGHVAVLLNRLRLFDVASLLGDRPVVAWSAGAMAVSERVVLFHDHPPYGAGNAEVLEIGLGFCKGVVPLPHARRRLRLDDGTRVGMFARRFAPAACVPMDEGARLDFDGGIRIAPAETAQLQPDGQVAALGAA